MTGTECPECKKEVMSFNVFFRKAEPHKKFRCENCGIELKRSNWVWFLIVAGLIFLGAPIIFVNLQEWTLIAQSISIVFLMAAYLVIVKFIGWKFIRWERVDSA